MYRPIRAIVLAAGEGTRMRSEIPKVLHPLCGRPMVLHVVDALATLPIESVVVVVGHGAERVTKTLQEQVATELPVEFVEQRVQRGTGDAVSVALTAASFEDADLEDDVLVVPGDAPLITPETLAALATEHRESGAAATLLTMRLDDPTGYGRILRDRAGDVERVVEEADADDEQRAVTEVGTSIYCFRRNLLAPALRRLSPENAQGEYYLTDVAGVLRSAGHRVVALEAPDPGEAVGVNDRPQLAAAESALRRRINHGWMQRGVTLVDPARTYIEASVGLEPDVRILPGSILEGRTVVGRGSVVGPDSHLVDAIVGDDTTIEHSVVRSAEIGDRCTVGPFAHVRPGTRIADDVRIGDFVELKNAEIHDGAKVPHLSYVGDAEVGPRANVGAGTITANYDGREKHRTVLGADVKTGSNSVFVAPVEVGDGATIGAGAVVTHDVPPGAVAKGVPARWEEPAERDDAAEGGDPDAQPNREG
jgi:bifunctional UDP-N-acetylglucosamine pyrophosphorylase/glucosamine-1-phosphate N-acetyltransferase